jgi:hypothetical protein
MTCPEFCNSCLEKKTYLPPQCQNLVFNHIDQHPIIYSAKVAFLVVT